MSLHYYYDNAKSIGQLVNYYRSNKYKNDNIDYYDILNNIYGYMSTTFRTIIENAMLECCRKIGSGGPYNYYEFVTDFGAFIANIICKSEDDEITGNYPYYFACKECSRHKGYHSCMCVDSDDIFNQIYDDAWKRRKYVFILY